MSAMPTPAGGTGHAADPTPAWHTLAPEAVESRLGTGNSGLSTEEAAARLEGCGPNRLKEAAPPSDLAFLLHQFKSPLIYILLLAAAVTIALREFLDAAVIAVVLLLNAIIGFVQERQADRSVRALQRLVTPRAHVVRDGVEREIDSADLVPGDLVLLESGGRVPADLRLFTVTALAVDESLLTGESVPASKRTQTVAEDTPVADRVNMAYAGAVVTTGRARGYVVATGTQTELGQIAELMRTEKERATPLQVRMTRFARIIGVVVAVCSVATVVIGTVLGSDPGEMFLVAVALAVSAIPEGLPVVFTITLALGVRRMAARKAIIRRLPAVETLGSTTVIGSDKTGTLTENRMTVMEVWAAGSTWTVPGTDRTDPLADRQARTESDQLPEPLLRTMEAGVLTNEATARFLNEEYETHGDPTEAALIVAAHRFGLDPERLRVEREAVSELPFESERRFSASLRRAADGGASLYVKGAPERVLDMCSKAIGPDEPEALDRGAVLDAAHDMAARGLRVLAMAVGQRADDAVDDDALENPSGLTFAGLQGLVDPPRRGVSEAIAGCKKAGIRVIMITGDHAATARAIAHKLGIVRAEDAPVLTGVDLSRMGDAALAEGAAETSIYARVSPAQKLHIVRALQDRGEVVAVTGDGVNDATALKRADIGIAMGKSGTDIAREASDMVLTDDNFVSIYAAVEEGRVTFDNLRKVTFFLVSTGAAEILMILTALAIGWPLPLLPAQILWLNLVTNGLQDVALAFEPGEKGVLDRPPRRRNEDVMSPLMWERTLVAGLVMATGTLLMFRWALDTTGSLAVAQSVALTTMIVFQAFHAFNSRSESRSIFRMNPLSNPYLFAAVIGALAVHVLALWWEPTQFVLRLEPFPLDMWWVMIVVATSLVAAMEIHKLLRSRRPSSP